MTSVARVVKSEEEWKRLLGPERYRILRQDGTEPAFHNQYWNNHEPGTYVCGGCGNPLFSSDDKFDSGTGWPSFIAPIDKNAVTERSDRSYGMVWTAVECARCGGHLGHVFDDGPRGQGGLRYCINSASLRFIPKEEMEKEGYGAFLDLAR